MSSQLLQKQTPPTTKCTTIRPVVNVTEAPRCKTAFIKQYARTHTTRPSKCRSAHNRFQDHVISSQSIAPIKAAAQFVSLDDLFKRVDEKNAHQDELEKEANLRKRMFRQIDKKKEQKTCGSENAVVILDRATLARQEQAEEMKKANKIILATKCLVVREAQIAEKYEIEKEQQEEQRLQEKLMREECEKALKEEEKRHEELKQFKFKYGKEIKSQLEERERGRQLNALRVADEGKRLLRAQEALKLEVAEKDERRHQQKMRVKADLDKSMELTRLFKQMEFESRQKAEMKALEYQKQKQIKEEEFAKTRQRLAEQKQKENDRILRLQTEMLLSRSDYEEVLFRKTEEDKEREFREREKQAAIRRKEAIDNLIAGRVEQKKRIEEELALMHKFEKEQNEIAVSKLKKQAELEKERVEKHDITQKKYRSDIVKQMNDCEQLRRELIAKAKEERLAMLAKDEDQVRILQTVISSKVEALRNANIPEKYIKDVERQMEQIIKPKIKHFIQ